MKANNEMKQDLFGGNFSRSRGIRKTSNHRKILDAAMQIFAQCGYAATDLGDVARVAGVAKGTVYLHFIDKAGLFEQSIDDWMESRTARLDRIQTAAMCLGKGEYEEAVERWLDSHDLNSLLKVWTLVLSRSFESPYLLEKLFEQVLAPCVASAPWLLGCAETASSPGLANAISLHMQLVSLSLLGTACISTHGAGITPAAVTDAMVDLLWHATHAEVRCST